MRELVARGIITSGHALATPLITQAPVERVSGALERAAEVL